MANVKNPVGDRIREARKRLGLSQTEVADAVGITTKALSEAETGKTLPRRSTLAALEKVLQLDPGSLLTETLPENLKPSVAQLKQLIEDPADRIPFALIENLLKRFLAEAPAVRAAVLSVLYGDSSISSLVVGETGKAGSQ